MKRREEIVTATLGCRQNYVDLKRPITPDDVADAFEKGAYWADKTMMTHEEELEEFKELVRKMREAQRNYYKDRPKVGYKVAYQNMVNKEQLVDKWLQEQAGSSREE